MLIDTHCHLDKKDYEDLDILINQIKTDNMKIIVSGYNPSSNKEVIALANKYPFIYASIGFHPEEASDIKEEDYFILEEQLKSKKIVAIGEIGLDYHWDNNKEKQQEVLKRQLELAQKYHKPVIIHCRDAYQDLYNLLKERNNKGVFHCFSGSYEEAKKIIEMNYLLGIGGIITFKNAYNMQEVIKNISLKNIVLETDSPYLTPEPFRGKKNDPLKLTYIARKVSEIKSLTYDEVCSITTENAIHLFDLNDDL